MKIESQNIFFCSDLHIGHENVIKFDNRPFVNLEEMHQKLIENWNAVIKDEDLVFYLGDFSFKDRDNAKKFRSQLKGKIHFILGNHDRYTQITELGFKKVYGDETGLGGATISVKDEDAHRGYQDIILCHYPLLIWNKSHYGSWHIHGHCHQSLQRNKEINWYYTRKVIDVGINGIEYTPISYQKVKNIMEKRVILTLDHH